MKYKNIIDYIRQNMDNLHGEFSVVVTDVSEKEEGCLLVTIHQSDRNGNPEGFYIYADGREEYTTMM